LTNRQLQLRIQPEVSGENGNGRPADLKLLRAVESGISAVPKTIRSAYPRDELVNASWLILKSRGIRNPSRLQVRCAAIDQHRMNTHYRRGQTHRTVDSAESLPDDRPSREIPTGRAEIVDHLRDIRRRFGTDGLASFLLSRIIGLPNSCVVQIMDYHPKSALAQSVGEIEPAT